MKKIIISTLSLLIAGALLLSQTSCEKEGGSSSTNVSTTNGNRSHNMGQNCMNCHRNGGQGDGWFTAAGTMYKADLINFQPNTTVYLYTGPNASGNLVATLNVDAKGNFFTTNAIDFSSGLYPVAKGPSGTLHYMSQVTRTGACNGCHNGSTTDHIYCD